MINHSYRILIIAKATPFPPSGGSALRTWQNINILRKYGEVGVFYACGEHEHAPNSSSPPGINFYQEHVIRKRPFWEALLRRPRVFFWWLTRIPPLTDITYNARVAKELRRLLQEFQPDCVIFAEHWLYCYWPVVKEFGCRVIYDAHNAETYLYEKLFNISSEKSILQKINLIAALKLIRAREVGLLKQADQVWACSESDVKLLTQTCAPKAEIAVIPNGVDVSYYQQSIGELHCQLENLIDCAYTLIYTASFSYAPNISAAHCLINEIFPKLQQKYPNVTLLLVGSNPTAEMVEAAKNTPGIVVTGRVPDIRPYLTAATVSVVPLQEGGGTRLKILEAFAAGCPVVSTAKGAEGIDAKDGIHLLIRDDSTSMVDAIAQIWQDPTLRKTLAQNACQLVSDRYSWNFSAQKVHDALKALFPTQIKTDFEEITLNGEGPRSIEDSQETCA